MLEVGQEVVEVLLPSSLIGVVLPTLTDSEVRSSGLQGPAPESRKWKSGSTRRTTNLGRAHPKPPHAPNPEAPPVNTRP